MGEEVTGNLGSDRSFEDRVFARFDALDARFNSMDARFDAMDARFNAADVRFDAMDARFNATEARFDAMDVRFNAIDSWRGSIDAWRDSIDVWRSAADSRFDRIERRMGELESGSERRALATRPIWERALVEIIEVKNAVGKLVKKVEVLNREMLTIKAEQVQLDDRLDKVENKPS